MSYSKSSKREKDLLKIQQERELTYSKSSKREREASGVQVGVACCVCVLLYSSYTIA